VEVLKTRDKRTGQYAHNKMEVLCVCGHPLAVHAAEVVGGARPCFSGDFTEEGHCECERFRKKR
jgi:hypothetical protein